jgi:hypothetical protein
MRQQMIKNRVFFLLAVFHLFLNPIIFSQVIDMKAIEAEEDLRWGIIAYNNGFYNKAVQSLEKSLALKPENPRTLMWLGRSYYMSGMEDAALAEWDKIISTEKAGASLINLSELVKFRQLSSIRPDYDEKWAIHMDISNMFDNYRIFDRPTAAVSASDGSGALYVVSFATNQVLKFSANGALKSTFDGGLEGYNHPFDIYPLKDGTFLLSEFSGNTVSLCDINGNRIRKIGEKGISQGQLLGPQFLASDDSSYFYVTDVGNRKIVKYDFEGNFILEMGRRSGEFSGLSGPAGVALLNDKVYIIDSVKKSIEVFDESGNYLETLIKGQLVSPEGLSTYQGDLLIADGSIVKRYSVLMDSLTVFTDRTGNLSRAMNIDFDENGNLLIADYDSNRVTVLSELSSVYGGLFVRINRINADMFPQVVVDFSVEKRSGEPVVGLERDNFILTEKSRSVSDYKLEFTGYSGKNSYVTVLVDGSEKMETYADAVTESLKTIYGKKSSSLFTSLISIGETPFVISSFNDSPVAEDIEIATSQWNPMWNPDVGIRLAASQMIPGRDRRSVIFITQGEMPENSFNRYDIIDLATYYRNNNISFFTVYTKSEYKNNELEYLTEATGGQSLYMFQPEGISSLLDEVTSIKSPIYTVSYISKADSDFGRAYLPVELEAVYVNKSGRDELGYYPPLE